MISKDIRTMKDLAPAFSSFFGRPDFLFHGCLIGSASHRVLFCLPVVGLRYCPRVKLSANWPAEYLLFDFLFL